MIEPAEVERLLRARFADAELELVDLTGTQDHYQARIVSSAFAEIAASSNINSCTARSAPP